MNQLWTLVIIPALLGAVFVVIQYFLAPRRAQLAIIPKNYAPLKMQLEGEFSEIELKYKGVAIGDTLGWISGFVFNEGPRDIHESVVSVPLKLHLPDGFAWRELRCTDHECCPEIVLENASATIKWSMLRVKERVRFTALLEAADALEEFFDGLPKSLRVSQRIADARAIVAPFQWKQYALEWSDVVLGVAVMAMALFFAVSAMQPSYRTVPAFYFSHPVEGERSIVIDRPYSLASLDGRRVCVAELSLTRPGRCVAQIEPAKLNSAHFTVRPTRMSVEEYLRTRSALFSLVIVAVIALLILGNMISGLRRGRYAEGGLIWLPQWVVTKLRPATSQSAREDIT